MSTVRVYKSTDVDAPAHPNATRGSMAALLRACLVTGYGSQPAAGWEEPFAESNNKACFRALSGAKQFYQVDDSMASTDVSALKFFDSMTDAETGIGERGGGYFGKRDAGTDGYSTQWFVIADEVTCYVFLMAQYGLVPHGFGEFFSYLPGDGLASFIAGHLDTSGLPDYYNQSSAMTNGATTTVGSLTALNPPICLASSLSGTDAALAVLLGISGSYSNGYSINSAQFFSAPLEGQSYPVYPGVFTCYSPNELGVRGSFRGIRYPAALNPKTDGEIFVCDGKTFIALNYGYAANAYCYGQLWVDITGSWEAS